MTTNRTAIRRRLAIRRTAHRPPWGGRKSGHRSIVAPLTATLAATVAATVFLGVGAALAKSERDRRSAKARRARGRERLFGLLSDEQPAQGLKRMALGQLDLAIELLEGKGKTSSSEQAVHETRKCLKRLGALMRLLDGTLDEQALAREDRVLRQAARRLSGARDAAVLLQTLDGLIERHPRKLARQKGIAKLRRQLLKERESAMDRSVHDATARAEVLTELRGARARVREWKPSGGPGIQAIEPGMKRLYRQGRSRYRLAAHGKGERGRELHRWRKRVKDLRYAAEALQRSDRSHKRGAGKRRGGKRHGGKSRGGNGREVARLRLLARRADELGELLGQEHDLAVLAERATGKKALLKLIVRRRRRLRKQALSKGERLYRPRPTKLMSRVRDAYEPV